MILASSRLGQWGPDKENEMANFENRDRESGNPKDKSIGRQGQQSPGQPGRKPGQSSENEPGKDLGFPREGQGGRSPETEADGSKDSRGKDGSQGSRKSNEPGESESDDRE
jgi:hypothetical protein